jgi:hypothetical protein
MGEYRTRTLKPGLQRMIDTFVADVPDWIDVPDTLVEIFRHQGVVRVLLGHKTPRRLTGKAQAELAVKVTNAARILLDPVIAGAELDPYSERISDNVLAYLMSCDPGIAWLALRNSWGYEAVNRRSGRPAFGPFLRFAARFWMPIFKKIRTDPIFQERRAA